MLSSLIAEKTDPELESLADSFTWVHVGQLSKLFKAFKQAGVKQVAFAGGIKRAKLFNGIKLDLKGIALIAKTGSSKDDVILRAIAAELEKIGIEVISPHDLLTELRVTTGYLTRREMTPQEISDAKVGWSAAEAIGRADIGQTVVVNKGVVVAVESIEGTDATLRRAFELSGRGGVVVKLSKPQQDGRLDLPTIGPETIRVMKESGISCLVLRENGALILEPQTVVTESNSEAISIGAFSAL